MEYITSGDRIAVENFEIGSLYKVTFLNEIEVYFMCCGIGKDFVMLMSNEPRLFSLTMLSAAEVDAIDEYTPLPPPPTNLLQYQTGEPPFTFTTTDTELFSWYIKGPAGVKTANLLNMPDSTFSISSLNCTYSKGVLSLTGTNTEAISSANQSWKDNLSFYLDAGTYSLNIPEQLGTGYGRYLRKYDDDAILLSTGQAGITLNERTQVYIGLYITSRTLNDDLKFMLSKTQTPIAFEPFGYKIPISCNTTISNIYIEEALGENDILYSTDTTYTIATELGDNLLQVQGETQPSLMQIVYKWEFEG